MMVFDSTDVVRRLIARLKIRHLMLLLQIEQHGSITRAAEHMSSSQPAVTHALAELEDMFGAPLFDRSVRGMMPTALGELVLARARTITEDLGHLVSDMEAVVSGHAAHIHIGVVRFVPGRLLAAVIQRARSEGDRHVSVTIREGTSDQLLT
jgi:DNA-binding transcriptional LysR family regulator